MSCFVWPTDIQTPTYSVYHRRPENIHIWEAGTREFLAIFFKNYLNEKSII